MRNGQKIGFLAHIYIKFVKLARIFLFSLVNLNYVLILDVVMEYSEA